MGKCCVICGLDGHTYLECPTLNFFELVSASFGGPTQRPLSEIRADCQKADAMYNQSKGDQS